MQKITCFTTLLCTVNFLFAGIKDSVVNYILPDSVQAVSIIASFKMQQSMGSKKAMAGIKTSQVSLSFEDDKNQRSIVFIVPLSSGIIATGLDVKTSKNNTFIWNQNWQNNETYKLLIATAADSAGNFILYSGYIYFPKINKWKLIGTCKINGYTNAIKNPQSLIAASKKNSGKAKFTEVWCQRDNGSWKNLLADSTLTPVIIPVSNLDSARQAVIDQQIIEKAIASGKSDAVNIKDGLYYSIIKEGTGRQVSVKDSVTIFYKGYLFSDGTVFDQTNDQTRTFPLHRLIRGWQLGVPLCKTGGKIKIVIPSGLGYTIRTRAAKIPPNSILVFEIEVVDAKSE
jgi:FKBP-type peptidyl-prolyl cis-trans isomerase FkpA